MADSQTFEVDVNSIIDSLVSPDELAYLQSLGEFFFCIDFVFRATHADGLQGSQGDNGCARPVLTKSRHLTALDFVVVIDFTRLTTSELTNKYVFVCLQIRISPMMTWKRWLI